MSKHEKKIDGYVEMLEFGESSLRREAVEKLSATGSPEAARHIVKLMKDESKAVQQAAADALIEIGGRDIVKLVLSYLYDGAASVRNLAIEILESIGGDGQDLIMELFTDKDPDVRKFAVDILRSVGSEEIVESVITLLKDPNPNVRAASAETLGVMKDTRAIEPLIALLADEEWVRFSAVGALTDIGDKKVIPHLLKALKDAGAVQFGILDALGAFKDAGVVPELLDLMKNGDKELKNLTMMSLMEISEGSEELVKEKVGEERFLHHLIEASRNQNPDVRRYALKGLGTVDDPIAAGIILKIAHETDPADEEAMHDAMEALAGINSANPLLTFLGTMNLKEVTEKEASFIGIVIDALGRIGDKTAAMSLENIFFDVDEPLRVNILTALGQIAYKGSLYTMIKALKERNGHVRREAARALGSLKSPEGIEPLASLIEAEDFPDVLDAALTSIVSTGGEKALKVMLNFSESKSDSIREVAVKGAGLLGMNEAEGALVNALKDPSWKVRKIALNSLQQIGFKEELSLLLPLLQDENDQVRGAAVSIIGTYEGSDALSCLFQALKDESMLVRFRAVEILGEIGGEEVINTLIELVQKDGVPGKVAAIKALGTLKEKRSVDFIRPLLDHGDEILRDAAVDALSEIEKAA
jgi:HEAT repeat protein